MMPRPKNKEFIDAIINNLALSKPKTVYRLAKELNTSTARVLHYIPYLQSKGIIHIKQKDGCNFVYLNTKKKKNF